MIRDVCEEYIHHWMDKDVCIEYITFFYRSDYQRTLTSCMCFKVWSGLVSLLQNNHLTGLFWCFVVSSVIQTYQRQNTFSSNTPLLPPLSPQVIWVCNQCRKQQDILTKSGEWLGPKQLGSGGGLGSAVSDPAMGGIGDPSAGGQKKARSRSQAPLGSNNATAQQQPGGAVTSSGAPPGTGDMSSSGRSRSEPPRERWVSEEVFYFDIVLLALYYTVSNSK